MIYHKCKIIKAYTKKFGYASTVKSNRGRGRGEKKNEKENYKKNG